MTLLRAVSNIVLALIITLIAWEGILRCGLFSTPIPHKPSLTLGLLPAPHTRAIEADEGWARLQYNNLGLRGAEDIGEKQPGEKRILMLGDSHTEARQMPEEKTSSHVLQTLLRAEAGSTPIRVINAGRNASIIADYVGLADEYKKLLKPDWVVIVIRNEAWSLQKQERNFSFVPKGDSFELKKQDIKTKDGRLAKMLDKYHLRQTLLYYQTYKRIQAMGRNDEGEEAKPSDSKARANPRLFLWALQQLKDSYPNLILVHMPPSSVELGGMPEPTSEELLMQQGCNALNIKLIQLRPIFEQDSKVSHQAPFGFANTLPWFGHSNERGHALMAKSIFEYLHTKI